MSTARLLLAAVLINTGHSIITETFAAIARPSYFFIATTDRYSAASYNVTHLTLIARRDFLLEDSRYIVPGLTPICVSNRNFEWLSYRYSSVASSSEEQGLLIAPSRFAAVCFVLCRYMNSTQVTHLLSIASLSAQSHFSRSRVALERGQGA